MEPDNTKGARYGAYELDEMPVGTTLSAGAVVFVRIPTHPLPNMPGTDNPPWYCISTEGGPSGYCVSGYVAQFQFWGRSNPHAIRQCPDCDGEGVMECDYGNSPETEQCERCDGTGRLDR